MNPGGYQPDSANAMFTTWTEFLVGTTTEINDLLPSQISKNFHLARELRFAIYSANLST